MSARAQIEKQLLGLKRIIARNDRVEHIRALLRVLQILTLQKATKHRAQRRERLEGRHLNRRG